MQLLGKKKKKWPYEWKLLAFYYEEVSRGIVHTREWAAYMEGIQEEYDRRHGVSSHH